MKAPSRARITRLLRGSKIEKALVDQLYEIDEKSEVGPIRYLIERAQDVNGPQFEGLDTIHDRLQFDLNKYGMTTHYLTDESLREGLEEVDVHAMDADVSNKYVTASSIVNYFECNADSTPLWQAVQEGHLEVVKLFLAYGADPNVVEPDYGPMMNLCFENDPETHIPILLYLIEHAGANMELVDKDGQTPLMIAAICGQGVVELCELGADVHRTDLLGNTAVHHAINDHETWLPLITCLIEQGADISKGNNEGNTPLHTAAVNLHGQCDDVLHLLLHLGADVFARNNEGLMPIDLVEMDSSVRTVLEERMRNLTDLRFKRIPEADLQSQTAVIPMGAAADGAAEDEEDEDGESSSEDEDEDE